jgi:multifunctional beta-oxidation protein
MHRKYEDDRFAIRDYGWLGSPNALAAGWGYGFPVKKTLTPEDVISKWDVFTSFGEF